MQSIYSHLLLHMCKLPKPENSNTQHAHIPQLSLWRVMPKDTKRIREAKIECCPHLFSFSGQKMYFLMQSSCYISSLLFTLSIPVFKHKLHPTKFGQIKKIFSFLIKLDGTLFCITSYIEKAFPLIHFSETTALVVVHSQGVPTKCSGKKKKKKEVEPTSTFVPK